MPFYFDYDLLLLAVPAVLYAADTDRDPRLTAAWVTLAAELYVNAPLAGRLARDPGGGAAWRAWPRRRSAGRAGLPCPTRWSFRAANRSPGRRSGRPGQPF